MGFHMCHIYQPRMIAPRDAMSVAAVRPESSCIAISPVAMPMPMLMPTWVHTTAFMVNGAKRICLAHSNFAWSIFQFGISNSANNKHLSPGSWYELIQDSQVPQCLEGASEVGVFARTSMQSQHSLLLHINF